MQQGLGSEEWREVPGFPGLQASSAGRIRQAPRIILVSGDARRGPYRKPVRGCVYRPWTHQGRLYVTHGPVHRLVCLAFNGESPPGKPNALHEDGDCLHNEPGNLYWGTQLDNAADSLRHGTRAQGERNGQAKVTLATAQAVYDERTAGTPGRVVAKRYGLTEASVCDIFKGRTWPEIKRE